MEMRNLNVFVEVVRRGGFSRAAKAVFTTQSAVSKAIRQLEDELGLQLLERIGHRSTLTAAGEIVYRRALTILATRDDLIAEMDELRDVKRGALRLGLVPIGSDMLLAPVFAVYRKRYPGVEIRLVEAGGKRLEQLVRTAELDLAAAILPVSNELAWQSVGREPVDVLVAAGHSLARRRRIKLQAVADLPFLLFEEHFAVNAVILDACRGSGFTPTVVVRSSQIGFLVELVAANVGIAFLPRMIATRYHHPGVRQIALTAPAMHWDLALIWRREGYLCPAAKAWLALAAEFWQAGTATTKSQVASPLVIGPSGR